MIKKLWILPLSILVTVLFLNAMDTTRTATSIHAQVNATATNTPYSVGTEFVRIYQTPVPTCAPCFYIPLGTLTFTPAPAATATPIVYVYMTTRIANIYNNTGSVMERWPAERTFQTGDWIKNGRLYLGPTLPNRWISVSDYVKIQ